MPFVPSSKSYQKNKRLPNGAKLALKWCQRGQGSVREGEGLGWDAARERRVRRGGLAGLAGGAKVQRDGRRAGQGPPQGLKNGPRGPNSLMASCGSTLSGFGGDGAAGGGAGAGTTTSAGGWSIPGRPSRSDPEGRCDWACLRVTG